MQDFSGPGQAAIGQLTTLITNEAANDRAKVYLQAEQRRQMEKNFEVKTSLANQMMATDPNTALELFNDGLRGFGVTVTMDQFRPAMKGFEVVADLMRNNDIQGAQLTLKSLKDRGMLTNLNDAKKALELEQTIRQQHAQSQAETVMKLQYPEIDRAQQTVNAMRDYRDGKLDQNELFKLYGTTDMAQIEQRAAQDETIVQGFEDHASLRQTVQTAFMNNPGLADDVTKASLLNLADPEKRRNARLSQLLVNQNRTEKEETELNALALLSNKPQLIEALGLKNATTEKLRIQRELEAVGNRLGTIQDVTGVLDTAEGAVASIDPKAAGLPDGSKPMDEKAAQEYAKRVTIRLGEGQQFLEANAKRLSALDEAMAGMTQQLESLKPQLVGAPAARRAQLAEQQTNLTRALEASQAMKRLLSTHNPYQMAAQEAAVATATDEDEKKQAMLTLKQMQRQRQDDLDTLQDESLRLQRQQRLLHGHMTKADRDEDVERRLNHATDAVLGAMNKGMGRTEAVKQSLQVYGVKAADLNKQIDAALSDNETQAKTEFALLPDSQQTPQNAALIGRKWKVAPDKVLEGIKRPNTPVVQINQNAPVERKEIAEGRSQLDMIERIEGLYHPDFVGPLDSRVGRVTSMTGLIKDQESQFRSAVQLMRTELRKFYFGTAQSKAELSGALDAIPDLEMSDQQFRSSIIQTKKNVQSMLSRRLETMEQSGVVTPKKRPMEERYRELEKTGLPKPEIFKRLQQEGY